MLDVYTQLVLDFSLSSTEVCLLLIKLITKE